jgi:hypothetical protein
MKKDDETLGIDPEFTRPGVLSLLKQMKALTVQLTHDHDLGDGSGCEYPFQLPADVM